VRGFTFRAKFAALHGFQEKDAAAEAAAQTVTTGPSVAMQPKHQQRQRLRTAAGNGDSGGDKQGQTVTE
jgi:hypothetical protein